MGTALPSDEMYIKAVMIQIRRTRNGAPVCDMCQTAIAQERHHVIPRFTTSGNVHASALANQPHMTALLCKACHDTIDMRENRDALLQNLYRINGRGNIFRGFEMIEKTFLEIADKLYIGWTLPQPTEKTE